MTSETLRTIDIPNGRNLTGIEPGPAPILQWIDIEDLVVDDSYQRDLKRGNWTTITKIAANFQWARFSPVFVSPVEGGRYAIIDGQHRTHAAAACGVEKVPCQIVHMTRAEQAASFAAVNGTVTKVTAWQVFKAALAAGEGWAAKASSIATEAGCTLMTSNASSFLKKPGQIFGVTMFRKIAEKNDRAIVVQALRVLMSADGFGDDPEVWANSILGPLLNALCSRPKAIAVDGFVRVFGAFDIWSIIAEIDTATKQRIRSGQAYVAKKDQLEAEIVTWIDRKFPERVALPDMRRKAAV